MTTRVVSVMVLGLAFWAFTSASGAEPAAAASNSVVFLRDVMPWINRLGCNSVKCHGAPLGQGGMALSLFGGDPEEDYETLAKAERAMRIDRMEPAKSLLLLKATATIPHTGGQKIPPGSPQYRTLLSWIEHGAPLGDEKLPALVAVRAAPAEQVLKKGQTQPLTVTAVFSDGSQTDVTRLASYLSTDAKAAAVDAEGNVKAEDFGQCAIVASYLRQSALARFSIPQPLESPFPVVPPNNKIDELVLANLKTLGFPPSEPAADEVFLRRVYLDVIGTLPTPDEARAFLADTDAQKRSKLIDRLLERKEFADFWALKWGDLLKIKAEEPINLWPKAAETYHRWVRDSIAENKPYDRFVRELLTSNGSSFRVGPANYVRAVPNRDSRTVGEATALVFLGARLTCARCHGHPVENWGLDDDLGMAAFFAQVATKLTGEWKEQIVYRDSDRVLRHPRSGRVVRPKPLGAAAMELDPGADPRRKLADWLTAPDNPWFAKNLVNRVWFWLLGRGIVHEPDDLRPTNPPENPALLEYLEKEFVGHRYDVKHVYRLVLNSKTYQFSSRPTALNEKDSAHFSHYQARRMTAEQILDSLSQITEWPRRFRVFNRPNTAPTTTIPSDVKAAEIAEASENSLLAAMFGRPDRATGQERERAADLGAFHVQFFVNSSEVEWSVSESPRIRRMLTAKKTDPEIVDEVFLAALSRFPKESEKRKFVEYLAQEKNRGQAVNDLFWAVLNTNEFLLNH